MQSMQQQLQQKPGPTMQQAPAQSQPRKSPSSSNKSTPTHQPPTSTSRKSSGSTSGRGRETLQSVSPKTIVHRRVARLNSIQRSKLSTDIKITQRHLEVFSELLTDMVPGEEHPEDVELLEQVAATSHEMQGRVVELISQITDQQDITVTLLEINDRMNSEMTRYQRYKAKRANRTKKKDPVVCHHCC